MIQSLRFGGVKPENDLETKTVGGGVVRFEVHQRRMWGIEYRQ